MNREETLKKAHDCVCQDRETDYGSPEDSFKTIAQLWTAYTDHDISAADVAIMMALLKIARLKGGRFKEDSFVDLAGYAACGAEITTEKGEVRGADIPKASETPQIAPHWVWKEFKTSCVIVMNSSLEEIQRFIEWFNQTIENHGKVTMADVWIALEFGGAKEVRMFDVWGWSEPINWSVVSNFFKPGRLALTLPMPEQFDKRSEVLGDA